MSDDLQKWMDASIKATQLKFALEDILTKNFTESEMESVKYKQLLGTVDQYLEHLMGKYRKEKEEALRQPYLEQIEKLNEELDKLNKTTEKLKKELEKNKSKSAIFNFKSASIATIGAIILKLVELLIAAIKGGS